MNMVVDLSDYVSAPDAAKELGIKYPALWARIDRGQIETLKVGRFHLIKKSTIKYLKDNTDDNSPSLDKAAG